MRPDFPGLYQDGWIEGLAIAHCRWHHIVPGLGGAARVTNSSYFSHDSVVVVRCKAIA